MSGTQPAEVQRDACCVVEGCDRGPVEARGMCGHHYKRWWRTGTVHEHNRDWELTPASEPIEPSYQHPALPPRIWTKIRVTGSGCWEWLGYRTQDGYGMVGVGGRVGSGGSGKLWPVHRLSFTVFTGAIPDAHQLDHYRFPLDGCIGPPCCHPGHLRPVTGWENCLRSGSFAASNRAKTHCSKAGHPLSGGNVYVYPDGRRECRTCIRARRRARRAAIRAQKGTTR